MAKWEGTADVHSESRVPNTSSSTPEPWLHPDFVGSESEVVRERTRSDLLEREGVWGSLLEPQHLQREQARASDPGTA